MAAIDMLLHLDSYPEATPAEAVDQAVAFAQMAGGVLSALAIRLEVRAPHNRLADYLIDLGRMAKEEEAKSLAACRSLLERVQHGAREAGLFGNAEIEAAPIFLVGEVLARRARTHDLCLVPIASSLDGQRVAAEEAIFGAGRPVLAYSPGKSDLPSGKLGVAVVAWDGGRAAARALADAIPLLKLAREVRLLTVLGEKPGLAGAGSAMDARRYLAVHGVEARIDEVDAAGRRIGAVLDEHLGSSGAELLVMGAYGSSRVKEFVLGGATEHVLRELPVATLFSH